MIGRGTRARWFARAVRDRGGQRGSAAVEFALVLPLVLILALATLELALITKDQLVVLDGARAGARQGAVVTDDASVRQAVLQAAVGLDPSRLTVEVRRDGGVGTAVEVTVTYAAPIAIPLVAWLFPSEIDLSSTAAMRQETQ